MLSGVGFGVTCSDTIACDDTNTGCINLICACISTAYNKKDTDTCVPSKYHNRITKTEWVNEPSLNIHLQRPKCCSTPVLLP